MIRFPDVESVRDAFKYHAPADKLAFYRETGIKPHWVYAFISKRPNAGPPRYDYIVKIVQYLETTCGVTFEERTPQT